MHFPRYNQNHIENFSYYSTDQFNSKIEYKELDLSVISFNIRGIDCNFDKLILFLSSLNYKFDVITLVECHIKNDELYNHDLHNTHPLNNYDKFYVRSNIRYGGIIMYVKKELSANYCNVLTYSHNTCDSLYVKINSKPNKPLFIGAYYRHCRATDIIPFIDKFSDDISNKILKKTDVIITGDFNICLMKSTHCNDSLCFLNTIIANHYEIMIFKPTRIQYYKDSLQIRSATLIDQIMTNLFSYESKSGNILYPDSDHLATFAVFSLYHDRSRNTDNDVKKVRILKNIDTDKLVEEFSYAYNWDTLVYHEPDLDVAAENLSTCIQELCDKYAPLQNPSNRMKKYLDKPWICNKLLETTRKKNRAFTNKIKIPTEMNRNVYEALNRQTTAMKRKNKKQYFKEYFEKFKNNSKKMWSGINLALEQTRHKKSLPSIVKDTDGKQIEGNKNVANAFAKYFESVPGKTKRKIPPYKHPYMHYLNKSKVSRSYLVLNDTNADEVFKYIMKLKNSSSPGPVDVPNAFLKLISSPLSKMLSVIINRSMSSGHVPKSMKVGKQTPVHKGGEMIVSNFRPITVCSSVAKILEKVVRDRVMAYLDRAKILNKSQFGFRSKHSTNHAVINLTESTLDALEKGLKVGGVYLDIAKAFDTVNFDILLRKLEFYGFRANTLMWFESYLKNREQFVNIKNERSETYQLKWGIPQGGTLAPILFILFMNDITNCSSIFDFSIYADDTCLILGINRDGYDETMKSELERVVDWFSSNELLLNVMKTDYLHFGPHHKKHYIKGEHDMGDLHEITPNFILNEPWDTQDDPDFHELNKKGEFNLHDLHKITPLYIREENIEMPDGTTIFEPENVKYLGVWFDNNFKFLHHIDILACKISRIVGILWKSQHLTLETKKMIYNGLVEAHLNYGIVTWASGFATNISSSNILDHVPESLQKIVKIQNKVIRAIFRKPNYDKNSKTHTRVTPLYKELNVLKVSDLYYYNLAILGHNFFHSNTLPTKIAEKLSKSSDKTSQVTRNLNNNLYYKTPSNTLMQKRPTTAISAYWNYLPPEIKMSKSLNTFKKKLKCNLIDKY